VRVTWAAPLDPGENPISAYRVQAYLGSPPLVANLVYDSGATIGSSTFQLDVSSLSTCSYAAGVLSGTCNQTYTFQVWAYNGSTTDGNNGGTFFGSDAGYGPKGGPASAIPLVGYVDAGVENVWTYIGCPGCHSTGYGPDAYFNVDPTLTVAQRRANATAKGTHIYLWPSGTDTNATNSGSPAFNNICTLHGFTEPCYTTMCGTACFAAGSAEYNVLQQWVNDGNQP
jgi:hypothetical protein